MHKIFQYADMVRISISEKLLAIDCKGEAFCLNVDNVDFSEDAVSADLSGKFEGMVSITSVVCIINNFTNNLVYVDDDGIRTEALNGQLFFRE